jgi:hypothetical protein
VIKIIKKTPIIDINGKRLTDKYKQSKKPFTMKVNRGDWSGENTTIKVDPGKNRVIIGGVEVKLEQDDNPLLGTVEYVLYFRFYPPEKQSNWSKLGRLYHRGSYWTAVDTGGGLDGLSRESKNKWEAIAQLVCNVV